MKQILLLLVAGASSAGALAAEPVKVELKRNDAAGQLQILIDGKEALVYQYGSDMDLPHYYPVRSPSGKLLTAQMNEPYPHHRSFWFADTIQLPEQAKPISFFMSVYTQVDKKKELVGPYQTCIRHVKFLDTGDQSRGQPGFKAQLLWADQQGKLPMLDEVRELRVVPLGNGEYLLDCRFRVTAAYGDITFKSDKTHYAWPYLRMHSQFAVERLAAPLSALKGKVRTGKTKPPPPEKGAGVITNSEGAAGESNVMMKPARWVDYSGTVDGLTEGVTIMLAPENPEKPVWFTRGYGTFGPRRADEQSGVPFVLKKGASLSRRVGVLVHSGDVQAGKAAERYQQYQDGKL